MSNPNKMVLNVAIVILFVVLLVFTFLAGGLYSCGLSGGVMTNDMVCHTKEDWAAAQQGIIREESLYDLNITFQEVTE